MACAHVDDDIGFAATSTHLIEKGSLSSLIYINYP